MKFLFLFSSFLLLFLSTIKSQGQITKIVVDKETNQPIIGAHVYKVDQLKTGTITNENGKFILKGVTTNDILEISHLSYTPFILKFDKNWPDTIRLTKNYIKLHEIVVHENSGLAIMNRVIDSITINHFVEPVMYEVFARVLKYEQDYSELHILSEYLMNVYQNQNHNSKFYILKTRAQPFSDAGEKYFKDMRMIGAISIYTDNIFKYQYDVFQKKKLKYYKIEIAKDDHNDDLIKLICTPISKKVDYNLILYIDRPSYAVKKIENYYSDTINSNYKTEIGFKKIRNKWYLDYSKIKKRSSLFTKWKSNSKAIYERLVLYNINMTTQYNSKTFKSTLDNIAEPIDWYLGDWSDDYWQNYNYVLLPDWIQNKISNINSR